MIPAIFLKICIKKSISALKALVGSILRRGATAQEVGAFDRLVAYMDENLCLLQEIYPDKNVSCRLNIGPKNTTEKHLLDDKPPFRPYWHCDDFDSRYLLRCFETIAWEETYIADPKDYVYEESLGGPYIQLGGERTVQDESDLVYEFNEARLRIKAFAPFYQAPRDSILSFRMGQGRWNPSIHTEPKQAGWKGLAERLTGGYLPRMNVLYHVTEPQASF
ncbi:MAG: hypothetical protein R3E13_02665 [Alphaproteobacteria bacterium]